MNPSRTADRFLTSYHSLLPIEQLKFLSLYFHTYYFTSGVYKVPYPSPLGKFMKSVGEEYQVVKRGREYHGCGEEYNI